ncbi:hypothetical protein OHS33_36890 [Streptomyces sp. NBC_00536]|uniref:hypothetical protein n=1 Tax=Streptomyces sp. NBC_00536 TaxID=2975769 RepID=UPI002E7FF793|nr:hypothetical protein [Streptomyces sp. NBC_00536]WUC83448.1 hypothetical protein OHS33_36890 [Streptomyces sp. NBC_00536]
MAATVAAIVLTGGCTTEAKDSKNATTTPSPSASPSASPTPSADPLATDKADVQTAYDRYWGVLTAAYAKADSSGTDLKIVASGSAYAQTESGLANLRKAGQVITGKTQHSGTAVDFKDGQKLKTAVITDCVDVSQWKPVDKKTGQEVVLPSQRLLRYITTLTAEKWPSGWVVIEEKFQDQTC